jgi:hypothetical protein
MRKGANRRETIRPCVVVAPRVRCASDSATAGRPQLSLPKCGVGSAIAEWRQANPMLAEKALARLALLR